MQATPTKLRSGNWGARVQGSRPHAGDEITITTRAGKSWTARVERVLWSGGNVHIVATEQRGGGGRRRSRAGVNEGTRWCRCDPWRNDGHSCSDPDCVAGIED